MTVVVTDVAWETIPIYFDPSNEREVPGRPSALSLSGLYWGSEDLVDSTV